MLVNCYGSRVIRNKGDSVEHSLDPDPPGLSPQRCAGTAELAYLVGAVDELDYKADIVDWYETYIFNSTKCLAVFR